MIYIKSPNDHIPVEWDVTTRSSWEDLGDGYYFDNLCESYDRLEEEFTLENLIEVFRWIDQLQGDYDREYWEESCPFAIVGVTDRKIALNWFEEEEEGANRSWIVEYSL